MHKFVSIIAINAMIESDIVDALGRLKAHLRVPIARCLPA